MLPLILYDLPSKLPDNYWSPNPAKPRFVLSYKGLPFQTEWVEYPDIASRMKEIGASPGNGDVYTVPVLRDPNTGAVVTDSFVIAEYLDKTYPEKPVFPHSSKALIRGFESAFMGLTMPAVKFAISRVLEILNKASEPHFVSTREKAFGEKFEEFSPEGPKRDAHWAIYESGLDTANAWYEKSDGKWLMGDTFSYADIIIASRLLWFSRVFHEDEWNKVCSWNGGRWKKLLEDVKKECDFKTH
ncbi:hypothetical protein F5I97DRAFT_1809208 [Phlebopus sp. FC_14]|nr:hypothetical protein F5I97DRAFT_1809208 [Phlebopus sp. FC_14]